MLRANFALVATVAALIATGAYAQTAAPPFDASPQPNTDQPLSQGHWYYCDPARAYYPSVRTCPAPWRAVTPIQSAEHSPAQLTTTDTSDDTLIPGCEGRAITTPHNPECVTPAPQQYELRHPGANTADEKAAGETAYNNCLRQTPAVGMPGSASRFDSPAWVNYRQLWRAKCDEAERAAIMQFRTQAQAQAQEQTQADRAAYEQTRAIEKAKSRGYELIPTVKDLILDGKDLAARNAKIQITGLYKKMGNNGVLYGSPIDLYSNSDNYVPVLTDDAARPVREALMGYACENIGCQIEVGGHMTMCEHLNLLEKDFPAVPCLNIDVMIVYRPGD